MTPTGSESGKGPLSLVTWIAMAIILASAAYLGGAYMAQEWRVSPAPSTPPGPTGTPEQAIEAAWLHASTPVEGSLEAGAGDVWQFLGHAGQSATLEMWLHPGSGSSVESELSIELISPDGTLLASETGSPFLLPYVVHPGLPETGRYQVRVAPTWGTPGRYSLALTLADPSAPVTPGASAPQPTPPPAGSPVAISPGQFQWPSTRREISGWTFHDPGNPSHAGLDIAAAMWDPIVSVASGVVVFAEWGGGYGNLVIVNHADGWLSYYAHLEEIVVEIGQEVRQGELLGGAGTTGYSTGPHLHFELRYNGRPVDPHIYLP